MNAAVPSQQSVITVKLVRRVEDSPALASQPGIPDLNFSQCEKSSPAIYAQRLLLAFRAHLPLTGSCLTEHTPLEAWVAQLQTVGLAKAFAAAAIPSLEETEKYLAANGRQLKGEALSSWPAWGLKVWIEEYKRSLSRLAKPLTQSVNEAITECDRQGASAPLSSWIKVWGHIGSTQAITYTLLGRGIANATGDFSQCEKIGDAPALQVSIFLPYMRGDRHHYVVSGHIVQAAGQYRYQYHLKNKVTAPALDLANLISNHRLWQVNCDISLLPFELISQCEKNGLGRPELQSLRQVSEFHVLGLHIREVGHRPTRSAQLPVLDVIAPTVLDRLASDPFSIEALSHRMPGVEPTTWMVDFASEQTRRPWDANADVLLVRPVSPVAAIWNEWLARCVRQSGGNEVQAGIFRSAKNLAGETLIYGSAMSFFSKAPQDHSHGRSGKHRTLSAYRFPIGSLIKHIAQQEADLAMSFQGDLAVANYDFALRATATSLATFLSRPDTCLKRLLRWSIFDCMTGVFDQAGFRYQVALQPYGYALAALPFYDLTSDGQSASSRTFGYRVDAKGLPEALISDDLLCRIAPSFRTAPAEALAYRDRVAASICMTAPEFLKSLLSGYGHLQSTQDFRTAKNRAVRALSFAQLYMTPKGERHE